MKYVVYSHRSYLDVLEIQTYYLSSCKDKVLIIDKLDSNSKIYRSYKKVITYDESLPYASRLLYSLEQLDDDYILLTNDTDIVLKKDDEALEKILNTMKKLDIDRVDLQYLDTLPEGNPLNLNTPKIDMGDFRLTKQEDTNGYIFNVNPSIWKLSTLLEVLEEFKTEGYRTIENHNARGWNAIQTYCLKYNIYKLTAEKHLQCGYMRCIDIYQYFHITRGGMWFPINGNGRRLDGNNFFIEEYQKIIDKFDLQNKQRQFRNDGNFIGPAFP